MAWTELTRRQHARVGGRYASDLTDAEWTLIEPLMPPLKATGRPRTTRLRDVFVNAGLKLHQSPEQKCATFLDLAGVKLRHFFGCRFVHSPARRSAPIERRSCAGLWSNGSAMSAR